MKRLQLDIPLMDKPTPTPTPQVIHHPEGTAFFENNIPLVSPQYDADVKTGRALALGATNDLAIEVADGGYVTVYDFIREEFVMYDDTGTEVTPV